MNLGNLNSHPAFVSNSMLSNALDRIGLGEGDTVYVASSMASLGFMDDPLNTICNLLIEKVGKNGTIIMPTFNFDFCKGEDFNVQKTTSNVGTLTEYFRKNVSTHRSTSPPYHSVCAKGHHAESISNIRSLTSFGFDSVFQFLLDINAKYLLIGVGFDAVPSFHWLEQNVEVPYRFWKSFSGNVLDGVKSNFQKHEMYARKEGYSLDLNPLSDLLLEKGKLIEYTVGWCQLKSFQTVPFTKYFLPLMVKDPTLLLDKVSKELLKTKTII